MSILRGASPARAAPIVAPVAAVDTAQNGPFCWAATPSVRVALGPIAAVRAAAKVASAMSESESARMSGPVAVEPVGASGPVAAKREEPIFKFVGPSRTQAASSLSRQKRITTKKLQPPSEC